MRSICTRSFLRSILHSSRFSIASNNALKYVFYIKLCFALELHFRPYPLLNWICWLTHFRLHGQKFVFAYASSQKRYTAFGCAIETRLEWLHRISMTTFFLSITFLEVWGVLLKINCLNGWRVKWGSNQWNPNCIF